VGPIPDAAVYLTDAVTLAERRGISRAGLLRALARAEVVVRYQYSAASGEIRTAPLSQRAWQMEVDGAFSVETLPPSHLFDSGQIMLQPGWGEISNGATAFVYRDELLAWFDRLRPRPPRNAEVSRAVSRVATVERVPREIALKLGHPIELFQEPRGEAGHATAGSTRPAVSGFERTVADESAGSDRALGPQSQIIGDWFMKRGGISDAALMEAKGTRPWSDLARTIAKDTDRTITAEHIRQWRTTMVSRGLLRSPAKPR